MGVQQIGDRRPDGSTCGGASTDKWAFFGGTPVVQPSGASQAAVTTSVTATVTTTNLAATMTNVITLLNATRSALVSLNLMKGSA